MSVKDSTPTANIKSSSSSNTIVLKGQCMEGITVVTINNRTYRLPTQTIPESFLKEKTTEIFVEAPSKNSSFPEDQLKKPAPPDNNKTQEEYNTLELNIPQIYHKFIIGKGGSSLNAIQRETSTNIKCTRGANIIVIKGTSKSVELAKNRLQDIVKVSTPKLPPNYFLSLPIADPRVNEKINAFHSGIMSMSLSDIYRSTLIRPVRLHITLGTLRLYRQEEVEGAVRLLKDLSTEISDLIGTKPVLAKLSGLSVMEEEQTKAQTLYARVEEPEDQEVLKSLYEFLKEKFTKAGYYKNENRPMKLHVTLIKTSFSDKSRGGGNKSSSRNTFSALPILENFGQIDFGTCLIDKLHICQMGGSNEKEYRSIGSINLS
ncbi:hypothetical protein G9A89_021348 [Geosiphon pyriformis]|nr:hypothetical protein G9A89_021348 [Geosiphon pyriformis]